MALESAARKMLSFVVGSLPLAGPENYMYNPSDLPNKPGLIVVERAGRITDVVAAASLRFCALQLFQSARMGYSSPHDQLELSCWEADDIRQAINMAVAKGYPQARMVT